ncbi:hypothetical protein PoB_002891400 [Plakobranchus ocellatus]|uniref:Uncharacterized protein n=1 Tax=Plakobranchus ocellatus TaxID=259542 RepID=A0AAV4A7B7_9GAST|nr:hypothetical protein PoB_002891400 [Plakobranchus ocellatus]
MSSLYLSPSISAATGHNPPFPFLCLNVSSNLTQPSFSICLPQSQKPQDTTSLLHLSLSISAATGHNLPSPFVFLNVSTHRTQPSSSICLPQSQQPQIRTQPPVSISLPQSQQQLDTTCLLHLSPSM